MTKAELTTENKELKKTLADLVDIYVANNRHRKGGDFISCITPPHAISMTKKERKANRTWNAFDRAMALTS